MGWANCGEDSKGRPIGYAHKGTCDHDGCEVEIWRGLDNACGGMHGEDGANCDGYFCGDHLVYVFEEDRGDYELTQWFVCIPCLELLRAEIDEA